jgi:hypothetical protein
MHRCREPVRTAGSQEGKSGCQHLEAVQEPWCPLTSSRRPKGDWSQCANRGVPMEITGSLRGSPPFNRRSATPGVCIPTRAMVVMACPGGRRPIAPSRIPTSSSGASSATMALSRRPRNYAAVYFYKQAVEKAGTADTEAVTEAFEDMVLEPSAY